MVRLSQHGRRPNTLKIQIIHHVNRQTGEPHAWLEISGEDVCISFHPFEDNNIKEFLSALTQCIDQEDAWQFEHDMAELRAADDAAVGPDISNGQEIKPDNNVEPKTEEIDCPF